MTADADNQVTSVAVLTPAGRSAVAVIAVKGTGAVEAADRHFHAANGRELRRQPVNRIVYGRWGGATGEELVVLRRGDDDLEIQCHGGEASVARIVEHLVRSGCVEVRWQQWLETRHTCPIAYEAHVAMADASTPRTSAILLDQFHGALRQAILAIEAELNDGQQDKASQQIKGLIERGKIGRRLTSPWRVVIAGKPNVGKSSLINAIVGFHRAIVFDLPGTTRDVVSATTAIDGWPVTLFDTAGLHDTADEVENAGMACARTQMREADLVVWVVDARQLGGQPTGRVAATEEAQKLGGAFDFDSLLVAANKIDLVSNSAALNTEIHAVCALSGQGLDQLLDVIAGRLVEPDLPPGSAVPFTERQIAILCEAKAFCKQRDLMAAAAALNRIVARFA